MTLPVTSLDDRHFQDIVDEAKRQIPLHCPEWTNHNVSDPGVALIELFAWMTEMTLYRINKVPDRLYTKFLELMGITMFGARAARADLTFWVTETEGEPVTVPAGTEVATTTSSSGDPVIFMTEEDLRIAEPTLVASLTSSAGGPHRSCWKDLEYGRAAVICFTSQPLAQGDCFYLGFRESLARQVVRLDFDADDIQGIGVRPARPPLEWEAWSGEDWTPVPVHRDETGGLNRDGPVELRVPEKHLPLTLGEHTAHWLRVRLVTAVGDQPVYTMSPRVYAVRASCMGGTVAAHHAERVGTEELVRSDGTPAQSRVLRHVPMLPPGPGETLRVVTSESSREWAQVEDFAHSGPDDLHFVVDPSTSTITFGPHVRYPDGVSRQFGAVPQAGASLQMTGYRHGGGARGNVDSGTLTVLRTTIAYVDRVENLGAATGGRDAEMLENAKRRGPLTLRSGNRAVTAADFEHLALQADDVVRARCLPPAEPGGPVRLLVVPRVDRPVEQLQLDDFSISDEFVESISRFLEPRRLLGSTIEIGAPFYQGVSVAALVETRRRLSPEAVKQRVLQALYAHINPVSGGTEGKGWPFDTDLNAGSLVQLLAAVDGVERVSRLALFTADARNQRRVGEAREVVRLAPDSLFLSYRHQVVVR